MDELTAVRQLLQRLQADLEKAHADQLLAWQAARQLVRALEAREETVLAQAVALEQTLREALELDPPLDPSKLIRLPEGPDSQIRTDKQKTT